MVDTYRTIAGPARTEIKVKGSRFIAEAFPVGDEPAAQQQIAVIRKREYDATHHCTAYRIGQEGDIWRYNDDGEPAGTAGQPILRQVDARGLTNVLVVVTRYFGGTKLGTGGLIRAYGDATSEVLEACEIEEHVIRRFLRLRFAYADTSPAMHVIGRFDARIEGTVYSDDTELTLAVRRSQIGDLIEAFTEALAGRGVVSADRD